MLDGLPDSSHSVSLSWALNLSEQLIPHLQQLDDGANLKGLL